MSKNPSKSPPTVPIKAAEIARFLAGYNMATRGQQMAFEPTPDKGSPPTIASQSSQLRKTIRDSKGNPPSTDHSEGSFPIARPKPPAATHPILTPADLGQLVRRAREDMRLSQQEFADLAGVGRRFVSELENGKPTLEFGKALKVAHAAGITLCGNLR